MSKPDPVGVMLLLAINNLICFGIGVLLTRLAVG